MLPIELTVKEAVRFSGYTRIHLYNLIHSEKIKFRCAKMRTGPIVFLIERASLEAYMQEQGRAIDAKAS
jgi:hypothetical protein